MMLLPDALLNSLEVTLPLVVPFESLLPSHCFVGSAVNFVLVFAFIKPSIPLQDCISLRYRAMSGNIIFSFKLAMNSLMQNVRCYVG